MFACFYIAMSLMPCFPRYNRKLAMRQQQMDDRRRQNMNHEYGRGGPAPTGENGGEEA